MTATSRTTLLRRQRRDLATLARTAFKIFRTQEIRRSTQAETLTGTHGRTPVDSTGTSSVVTTAPTPRSSTSNVNGVLVATDQVDTPGAGCRNIEFKVHAGMPNAYYFYGSAS